MDGLAGKTKTARSILATGGAGVLLLAGIGTWAPASQADTLSTTSVSSRVSATHVKVGTPVRITGTASGSVGRPVSLQMLTGTGWRTLATVRTSSNRGYSLAVPTHFVNLNRLRVSVPQTPREAAHSGGTMTVNVVPAYTPAGSSRSYSLLSAARWNPCQPITYRINAAGGYSGATNDIKAAFARMSSATGLTFRYLGPTSRVAFRDLDDSSTDITVSWATPAQVRGLAGNVAGLASSSYYSSRNHASEYVRGRIALDRTAALRRGFATRGNPTWGQIMTHEIGHVVGLGHVSAREQMMHNYSSPKNHRFGRGDYAGLTLRGRQAGCISNSFRTPNARAAAPRRITTSSAGVAD